MLIHQFYLLKAVFYCYLISRNFLWICNVANYYEHWIWNRVFNCFLFLFGSPIDSNISKPIKAEFERNLCMLQTSLLPRCVSKLICTMHFNCPLSAYYEFLVNGICTAGQLRLTFIQCNSGLLKIATSSIRAQLTCTCNQVSHLSQLQGISGLRYLNKVLCVCIPTLWGLSCPLHLVQCHAQQLRLQQNFRAGAGPVF